MKKIINCIVPNMLLILIAAFVLSSCSSSYYDQGNAISDDHSSYNISELNNYGEWVQIDSYGRAWYPFAVKGWMPFDNGHWSWLNGDWTWISYEPFGWIVYHYGYWYDDPLYGWVWIPSENAWRPANVLWITYDDYVCWAPLPPHGITYKNPWEEGAHQWHVVRLRDFTKDNIRDYGISNPPARTNNLEAVRNNDRIPPSKTTVERITGRSFSEVNMGHETIKLPPRQIQKMTLPKEENMRVEKNVQRVNNDVLISKDRFHKQQNEKSNRTK